MLKKLFICVSVMLCSLPLSAQQINPQDFQKRLEDALYGDLKKIEYFGSIHVHLKNTDSTKIGLNEEELGDFLRLRYRNNFGNVPYKDLGAKRLDVKDKSAMGYLWCGVSTVGDDFPIAYHVECKVGSMANPTILSDAVLGYGNKRNVPESIKKSLDNMISQFAIQFFKTRGEM